MDLDPEILPIVLDDAEGYIYRELISVRRCLHTMSHNTLYVVCLIVHNNGNET